MEITTYAHIPDYPRQYSAGAVIGRIIDGIGFRYHWATEGLSEKNLDYRPCATSRSISDTLHHVYNLMEMLSTTINETRYELPEMNKDLGFNELRKETLDIISHVGERFKKSTDNEIAAMFIKFKMGEEDLDFPVWNVVNGPVSDLLYHIGQIVGYRRAAGNPIDPKVNLFIGQRMAEAN